MQNSLNYSYLPVQNQLVFDWQTTIYEIARITRSCEHCPAKAGFIESKPTTGKYLYTRLAFPVCI